MLLGANSYDTYLTRNLLFSIAMCISIRHTYIGILAPCIVTYNWVLKEIRYLTKSRERSRWAAQYVQRQAVASSSPCPLVKALASCSCSALWTCHRILLYGPLLYRKVRSQCSINDPTIFVPWFSDQVDSKDTIKNGCRAIPWLGYSYLSSKRLPRLWVQI